MDKNNRTGLLEREHALDHYFQALLFNGHQESEFRKQESSAVEFSEIDAENLSN